jgi:hypothetical protein
MQSADRVRIKAEGEVEQRNRKKADQSYFD